MKKITYNNFQILNRLICTWVVLSAITIALSKTLFSSKKFAFEINSILFACAAVILAILFMFIKNDKIITAILILFSIIYAMIAVAEKSDSYFLIACCVIVSGIICFSKTDYHISISKRSLTVISIALAASFTICIGTACCLQFKNHSAACYDFGIFSQMFYYMKKTGLPLVTCERDKLLSHFAVHFSPVFYLLLPIYSIFPNPCTLMIAQCFIIAAGIIPLILICRNHTLSNISTLIFTACYLLYPCFAKSSFFYIHENTFLPVLILWMIYFAEKEKTFPSIIFAFLVLSVKEDAAVYVAVIALYFLFTNKNYKCNFSILAISIIYFIAVTYFINKYGDGVMTDRYSNYMDSSNRTLFAVIETAVKNPAYVISQCINEKKLLFIFQMLLPLSFLPFITKKPMRFMLLIPFILVNLMTDYPYQYNIGFQYCFASGVLLIYLAIINFSEIEIKKEKFLIISLTCSIIIFTCTCLPQTAYYNYYKETKAQRERINYALSLIPDDASVASSTFLLPNLSQRDEIYQLETTDNTAEYYVLDLRHETKEYSLKDFQNEKYEEIYCSENTVAVYKNIQNR